MNNEIELAKTPEQLEMIEKETRIFTCPCCQSKLQFRTRIDVVAVGIALTPEERAAEDNRPLMIGKATKERNELIEKNQSVLTAAEQTGVLEAFWQAAEAGANHVPKDRQAYFLKWLERASRQKSPDIALRQHLKNYEANTTGSLELWGFQDVSAILCDKEFKVFIPTKLAKGEKVEKLEVSNKGFTTKKQMDLPVWIRTKYGYVQQSKEFSDELRKHSIGGFQL